MPSVTRLFIKTGLVYFVLAFAINLIASLGAVVTLPRVFIAVGPVYVHLLVVGWITQVIIGVAHWMFPIVSRERPRGRERLIWITYGLLNLGLVLRLLAEPAQAVAPNPFWGWLLAVSALTQWLAGLFFVIALWPRVKER
jgi:hypothetical protein